MQPCTRQQDSKAWLKSVSGIGSTMAARILVAVEPGWWSAKEEGVAAAAAPKAKIATYQKAKSASVSRPPVDDGAASTKQVTGQSENRINATK